MCYDGDDCDYYYTTMDERDQRARKDHTCCACQETISPGHKYRVSRLISDSPDNPFQFYKHCLRCAHMLDAIRKQRPGAPIAWGLDCGEDWKDTIGELPEEVAALAFMSPEEAQQRLIVR